MITQRELEEAKSQIQKLVKSDNKSFIENVSKIQKDFEESCKELGLPYSILKERKRTRFITEMKRKLWLNLMLNRKWTISDISYIFKTKYSTIWHSVNK